MKIVEIELYHVEVPLKHTFWPTWIPGYPQTHNRFTLIKLVTDEGIEGYSAGTAMGKEREGLGDLLGGYLIGADPTDIDRIQSLLKQAGFLGWLNFWIEPACWDIIGKSKGKPVYELLGGQARPIEAYCSTGEMHESGRRVEGLLAMKERGFKTAKLRVKNKELKDDIKLIEQIRKGIGDKMVLGVDANQGWLVSIVDRVPAWDLNRAKEFAKACKDNDIEWLEEPLDWHDYDGLAALKRVSPVKISGAELNHGWDEIKIMFEKDCFHVYQPDATFAGGIAQVKQVIDACHKHQREFSPHTWTNGIGFYVNWNMVLADRGNKHPLEYPLEYPLEEPSWVPEFREGIIEPIIPDRNGMLQPFTGPGLGFEIDKRLLKKYGKRYFRMNERSLALKVIREKGLKTALELRKRKESR
ncbi:MAG: mandelate racemase/muconate lactonizing enzyme family protein [Chloroflexi bacterium]|nr:mandelate racemase/muconate lactonizing enzyme family protein [Chloroflexota bacterium]MBM3175638.1 mandelate racemase/muconate lactonizing enzyme family protein [Chloroflexota bacterium]MBM4450242.1 mandelate racemase/muconate lactonizing enzyme family protein [Chloroflexota bacterium]